MLKFATLLFAVALGAASSIQKSPSDSPPQTVAAGGTQHANANQAATPPTLSRSNAKQAQNKAKRRPTKNPSDAPKGLTVSDWIAVIASVVAFLQFLALAGTIWYMDRSDKRKIRAYIGVSEAKSFINGRCEIAIVNYGQTPAQYLTYQFLTEIHDKGKEPNFTSPQPAPTKAGTIAPTAQFHLRKSLVDCRTGKKIDAGVAWAWGEIVYKDAFGHERKTPFRLRGTWPTSSGIMANADMGNDAT